MFMKGINKKPLKRVAIKIGELREWFKRPDCKSGELTRTQFRWFKSNTHRYGAVYGKKSGFPPDK